MQYVPDEFVPEVCKKCKLYQGCKTPFMLGSGPEQPDVLIVGEAPGAQEDIAGEPFVGKSGQLLRQMLEVLEFDLDNVGFTNTVRCRPPDNRTPKANEVKYCSGFLAEEIAQRQPKVIILMGNAPLKALLGHTGITNWNGAVVEQDSIYYIPAYHPAFILRSGMEDGLLKDWMAAIGQATEIIKTGTRLVVNEAEQFDVIYPEYVPELEVMRDDLLSNPDDLIAYDIEVISLQELKPGNAIVSLAFANSKRAYTFPLDHKESFWTPAEREQAVDIIRQVLTQGRIITHTKFDCKMTRRLLGIDFEQYGDTIHLSMLVNAHHYEHGLKRLAALHLEGMYDYDSELTTYISNHPEADYNQGGNYGNIPLDILLPYGALDVIATRLLHDKLYAQLTKAQRALYEQVIVPADRVLGIMESNGFKLDYGIINRYRTICVKVKNDYYQELLADSDVQAYIAYRSKDNKKFKFNPNSAQHMGDVLFDYKQYPVYGTTNSGNPSVKREYLKEMKFDFETEGISTSFLDAYMNWKLISSVLSKSYNAMLKEDSDWRQPDGRVRSTYTLGGAKTGRTSSAHPNLQNIPTPEKEPGTILQYLPVKNALTHTWPGGCLCMIDYAGMELRVMASVAGIQGMLDVFSSGGDVHRYVSSLIYGIPEEEITKFQRYRGKWCNWSLLYRGNWRTLYRMYRINGLTEDEAKRVTDIYFKAFPELLNYHEDIIKFGEKHGYVESPFGRRLAVDGIHSPNEKLRNDVIRTAVNMPIQGAASDVLMAAVSIINYFMEERKLKSLWVNTVHDSVVLDIYPGELEIITELAVDVMENMPEYAKDFMPGVSFKWLKVPLKADVDVGTHYGTYGARPEDIPFEMSNLPFREYSKVWNSNYTGARIARTT